MRQQQRALSVSSLLDRFLRPYEVKERDLQHGFFQYPRCWIVSSDLETFDGDNVLEQLSVSSLLDRFLRRAPVPLRLSFPSRAFSILAVGSFPQTHNRRRAPGRRA